MMLLKSLVVTLCVIGFALAEQSPVFLWGAKGPSKSTLQTVTENDFSEIVSSFLKDHMVVVFEEDALSSNDFLCANSETSQSCYAYLQGVETKSYYGSVENPIEAIRSSTKNREFNTVAKNGELTNSIECNAGKVVFVTFESNGNDRETLLEQHDSAINAITKANKCPTVYMYTATPSTVQKRTRRSLQDTATTQGGYIFRTPKELLLFFRNVSVVNTETNERTFLTVNTMNTENSMANVINVTLNTADAKTIQFSVTASRDGYFTLSNVVFDNENYRVREANAPTTFSFFCGDLVLPCINKPLAAEMCKTKLYWESLQIQAPFNNATADDFKFGDSWDCVPFFTPGILMGLFVLILLLLITFTGICWMMDINTMDRFDDPKGKTITISATD